MATTISIPHPTTTAEDAAYALGAQDAQEGVYRPSQYFHFNDQIAFLHYDAGYTSVRPTLWTWSTALDWEAIEGEAVGA